MMDIGRPYSITFQCDNNPTYDKYIANNKTTTGCGHSSAIGYFMAFQVIVGIIFLNLFIAILVDSFIGVSDAFKLPVKQLDFDYFITVWSKYDPKATGFIKIE